MTNNLSLEVIRTTNVKTLILLDTSLFLSEPENYLVEILAPNDTKWKTFKVNPNFNLTLNASALGLCGPIKTSEDLPPLLDGVYEIKQSEKPNYASHIHYYHLRTSVLQKTYDETLCCTYSKQCSLSRDDFEKIKRELLSILMDIKAAIAKVELCHERKEGLELYNKAQHDLKKFCYACKC